MRPSVVPFRDGPSFSEKAPTAKLFEKHLGIGPKGVGDVKDAVRPQVTIDEIGQGPVRLWVIDDLGAENRVEVGVERFVQKVDPSDLGSLESVSMDARPYELQRWRLAVGEPHLRSARSGHEAREAETATEIEDSFSPKIG